MAPELKILLSLGFLGAILSVTSLLWASLKYRKDAADALRATSDKLAEYKILKDALNLGFPEIAHFFQELQALSEKAIKERDGLRATIVQLDRQLQENVRRLSEVSDKLNEREEAIIKSISRLEKDKEQAVEQQNQLIKKEVTMNEGRNYQIIIERIRKEANDVKSCFTTFSFQAIAFSGIILAAIVAYQPSQPLVGLAGIFIMVLVLTVSKIGNYKYATANRHFGFELYLDNQMSANTKSAKQPSQMGWEQGLRAWRVVQATLFDKIYYTKLNTKFWNLSDRLKFNQVREDLKADLAALNNQNGWWFEPSTLVGEAAKWYPGRYLGTMQSALHLFAYLSLIPLIMMSLQFQFGQSYAQFAFNNVVEIVGIKLLSLAGGIITILTAIVLYVKINEIYARRKLLESGLLSIHSCAIVWHVVELAHRRALERAQNHQVSYMKYLSEAADEIRKNAANIHKWINENTSKK